MGFVEYNSITTSSIHWFMAIPLMSLIGHFWNLEIPLISFMDRQNIKVLLSDTFGKVLFSKNSVGQGIPLGIAICVLLNIGWSAFYLQALEKIKLLAQSNESPTFSEIIPIYIKSTLMSLILKCLQNIIYSILDEKITGNLMKDFLYETMQVSYIDFIKNNPGKIIATIQNKIIVYKSILDMMLFKCISLAIFCTYFIVKTYRNTSGGAALITSIYPVAFIYLSVRNSKNALSPHMKYMEERKKNSAVLFDKIHNFDILKSYGLEEKEGEHFYQGLKAQRESAFGLSFIQQQNNLFRSCLCEISLIAIYSIMKYTDIFGGYTQSMLYIQVFQNMNSFLKSITALASQLMLSINELILDGTSIPNTTGLTGGLGFENTIEFRNVNIYHDDKLILQNINVVIRNGESIAIVGGNGSGKSTFIKTLLGFTKYTGDILIDSIILRDVSNKSIHKLISYVSQTDYISDDTILNNLRLGNKDISRETIESKAKLFDAHETFLGLRNGYEAMVGAKGSRLSGGQKQKLSLVRAAIKDAPVFIFDEATSAMDKGYEKHVLDVILNKFASKTILMIIHEKEYLKNFDRVFFLNKGYLEASGNYTELMNSNPNFNRFVSTED